jgi:hypothetical protein
VALVRTDVSEEHIASIIRVKGISKLGKLAVQATKARSFRGTYRLHHQGEMNQ